MHTSDITAVQAEAAPTVIPQNRIINRKQKGLTLIELVIAIAISALILVGIIYFATVGRNGVKTSDTISNMTSLIANSQALYGNDPNGFANATAAGLIQGGAVPKPMVNGTSIVSPFGTPITATPTTLTAGSGSASVLDLNIVVPSSECGAIVSGLQGGVVEVEIGGTVVQNTWAGTAYSAENAQTACGAQTGTAALDFVFGK